MLTFEKINPLGGKEVIMTHEIKDLCDSIKRRNEDTLESPYLRTFTFPDCPIPPVSRKTHK